MITLGLNEGIALFVLARINYYLYTVSTFNLIDTVDGSLKVSLLFKSSTTAKASFTLLYEYE